MNNSVKSVIAIILLAVVINVVLLSVNMNPIVPTGSQPDDPLEAWSESSVIIWQYNTTFYAARNMSTNMVIDLVSNLTRLEENMLGNMTTGLLYLIEVQHNGTLTVGATQSVMTQYHGSYTFTNVTGSYQFGVGGATGPAGPAGTANGLPYSYLIFNNATSNYMVNGTTGAIDYQSTNATKVFNFAIGNISSNGKISVKEGEYNITCFWNGTDTDSYGGIEIVTGQNNIEIEGSGWGTVFKTQNGTQNCFDIHHTVSGIYLHDFAIDGGATQEFGTANATEMQFYNGIRLNSEAQNCTVEHVLITHTGRTGIYNNQQSDKNLLTRNFLNETWRYGISYSSSSRGRITENYFLHCKDGVNWDGSYGQVDFTIIADNIFENSTDAELNAYAESAGRVRNGAITGNVFNTYAGGGSTACIMMSYVENTTFTGNTINYYGNSLEQALQIQWCKNLVIASNVIKSDAYQAISIDGTSDIKIQDNMIDIDSIGIQIGQNVDSWNVTVQDNTIIGYPTVAAGPHCINGLIEGNMLQGLAGDNVDAGASVNTIVRWNIGYKTEGSASSNNATATTWTFTIANATALTRCYFSFNATVTDPYWSATGTTLTITAGATIAADHTACYVEWYCWNYP